MDLGKLKNLIFFSKQAPEKLAKYLMDNQQGAESKSFVVGKQGVGGVNGLTPKLSKTDTHIVSEYIGSRALTANYNVDNSLTRYNTYGFTKLDKLTILDLPKEVTSVKLEVITFNLADNSGKDVGSINATAKTNPNSYPILGALDPTNGKTTYKVVNGSVQIKADLNTKEVIEHFIQEFNKATKGEKATQAYAMQYTFSLQGVSGTLDIRETFIKDIDDKPKELVALSELKGADAPKIQGVSLNIAGAVVSGKLTMSDGSTLDIQGTFAP